MAITEHRIAFFMEGFSEIRDEIALLDIDVLEQMDGDDTLTGDFGRPGASARTSKKFSGRKQLQQGKSLEHQQSMIRMRGGHDEGHEGTSFRIYNSTNNRNYYLRLHDPSSRCPFCFIYSASDETVSCGLVEAVLPSPSPHARRFRDLQLLVLSFIFLFPFSWLFSLFRHTGSSS